MALAREKRDTSIAQRIDRRLRDLDRRAKRDDTESILHLAMQDLAQVLDETDAGIVSALDLENNQGFVYGLLKEGLVRALLSVFRDRSLPYFVWLREREIVVHYNSDTEMWCASIGSRALDLLRAPPTDVVLTQLFGPAITTPETEIATGFYVCRSQELAGKIAREGIVRFNSDKPPIVLVTDFARVPKQCFYFLVMIDKMAGDDATTQFYRDTRTTVVTLGNRDSCIPKSAIRGPMTNFDRPRSGGSSSSNISSDTRATRIARPVSRP